MTNKSNEKIIVYGTPWCGDCHRSKRLLDEMNINYKDINIENDDTAAQEVIRLNRGFRSVPTIVFPDGSILVEPSNQELKNKLSEMATSQ